MSRPAVDVVVPFVGPLEELEALRTRLARLEPRPGDSVLIVDNTPGPARDPGPPSGADSVPVLRAVERRTPGYARNRGAARGGAPWIVFFDTDSEPSEDLLDRYFEPEPADRTGLIGGGVRDEPALRTGLPAVRYAYIRAAMSQDDTFRMGQWGFPKSANVAVRRRAFDAAGGFREDIRAGEDADLSYRLRAAGWEIERREHASVTHRNRQTLGSFAVQKALHGAGGAWLARQYPGSFPPHRRVALMWWAARTVAGGLLRAVGSRDRDAALWAVFEPVEALAWELGRSLPNERPLTASVWGMALCRLRLPPGTPRL